MNKHVYIYIYFTWCIYYYICVKIWWICVYIYIYKYAWHCMAGISLKIQSIKKAHIKPPAPKSAVETRQYGRSHWLSAIALWLQQFRSNQESPDPNTWQLDQPLYHAKVQHIWMVFLVWCPVAAPMIWVHFFSSLSTDVMKRRTSPSGSMFWFGWQKRFGSAC